MGYGSDNAPGTERYYTEIIANNRKEIEDLKQRLKQSSKDFLEENDTLRDTVEYLRAYTKELENRDWYLLGEERDNLLVRVEDLEESLAYWKHDAKCGGEEIQDLNTQLTELDKERDNLQARVDELDQEINSREEARQAFVKERDELRTEIAHYKAQVKEVIRQREYVEKGLTLRIEELERQHVYQVGAIEDWMSNCEELRGQLAALTQPKIVRYSRWQNLYAHPWANDQGAADPVTHGCREGADEEATDVRVAVLRRDHMSDGTVTVTLEPVDQSTTAGVSAGEKK